MKERKVFLEEYEIPPQSKRRVIAGKVDITTKKPRYTAEFEMLAWKKNLVKCDEVICEYRTYYAVGFMIENNTEYDPLTVKIYRIDEEG